MPTDDLSLAAAADRTRWPPAAQWVAGGLGLLAGACAVVLVSPAFDTSREIEDMPVLATAAALALAGLAFSLLVPRLLRHSQPPRAPVSSTSLMLGIVIAAGIVARLVLFASEPILEDDYYRYLWDGAVLAHGLNPYTTSPYDAVRGAAAPAIVALAREAGPVAEHINNPELRTIYPPLAQMAFALAHLVEPFSLASWRMLLLFADLTALALLLRLLSLAGRSRLWCALYWWNPIVLKEAYNSAHMDIMTLPFVLGALLLSARGRPMSASASLACAVGVKIWPVLLLPLIMRPVATEPRRLTLPLLLFAVILSGLALPVLIAGIDASSGFQAYVTRWQTNSALFPVLNGVAGALHTALALPAESAGLTARGLIAIALALLALGVSLRPLAGTDDLMGRASLIAGALLLLSPAQFPWYFLWFAPFLAFRPWWGFILLAATLPLYYSAFHFFARGQPALFEQGIVWVIWLPVWLALLAQWCVGAARPALVHQVGSDA